jgi:hypothetical protein
MKPELDQKQKERINLFEKSIRMLCEKAETEGLSGPTYRLEVFNKNNVRVFNTEVRCEGENGFAWQRNYPEITGEIKMHLIGENGKQIEHKFEIPTEAPATQEAGATA